MVYFTFYWGDKIITWSVSSNSIYRVVYVISVLLTLGVIYRVKWHMRQEQNLNKVKEIPKSGDQEDVDTVRDIGKFVDLSPCFKSEIIYEVVNGDLKKAILSILDKTTTSGMTRRLLIDTRVALVGLVTTSEFIQISKSFMGFVGFDIATVKLPLLGILAPMTKVIMVTVGTGVATGIGIAGVLLYLYPLLLAATNPIIASAVIVSSVIGLGFVSSEVRSRALYSEAAIYMTKACEQFVRPVHQIQVVDEYKSPKQLLQYVPEDYELPKRNIYIYDSVGSQNYYKDSDLKNIVENEMTLHLGSPIKESNSHDCINTNIQKPIRSVAVRVEENCPPTRRRSYIPLKDRTMTLEDLNKHGEVKRKDAQSSLDSFESKSEDYALRRTRQFYADRRQKIKNNRQIDSNESSKSESRIQELLDSPEF